MGGDRTAKIPELSNTETNERQIVLFHEALLLFRAFIWLKAQRLLGRCAAYPKFLIGRRDE
jgi:hypothetical protein